MTAKRAPSTKPVLRTWWGKRWAEAFAVAAPEPKLRGRGKPRAARLRSLDPATGEATVEVTTTSVLPYEVRIAVTPIARETWDAAMRKLSGRALFAAKLLASELPAETEEIFVEAGGSLFPGPRDVRVRCSCPAGTAGCRHAALAQRAMSEAIDRDPFLLFDLRGRPRAEVLAALGVKGVPGAEGAGETAAPAAPAAPAGPLPDADPAAFRRARGDLAALRFHVAPPEREHVLLTRLGDPPGWRSPPTLVDQLGTAVTNAAARAREIAVGDDEKAT
ncbi:MAG TPA: hypothetical protein VMV18_08535 [bacterium]|nr:hypothetical protein [bacterium]